MTLLASPDLRFLHQMQASPKRPINMTQIVPIICSHCSKKGYTRISITMVALSVDARNKILFQHNSMCGALCWTNLAPAYDTKQIVVVVAVHLDTIDGLGTPKDITMFKKLVLQLQINPRLKWYSVEGLGQLASCNATLILKKLPVKQCLQHQGLPVQEVQPQAGVVVVVAVVVVILLPLLPQRYAAAMPEVSEQLSRFVNIPWLRSIWFRAGR